MGRTQKNKVRKRKGREARGARLSQSPRVLSLSQPARLSITFSSFSLSLSQATEYHLGQLKAKLAKLRTQLQEPSSKGGASGEGFEVQRYGDARVAMIGFPSVGKSSLLTALTGTQSEAAAYEFTTLTCIPGVIHHRDAKIQLLDLPGIIEGAAEGRGRGRQVIAVCKSADLLLMVLDASRPAAHAAILTRELEAVGMRLNRDPPAIYYKPRKTGGIAFNATAAQTKGLDATLVQRILHEYKIHNAEVLVRGDCSADDLIDVIEGNRRYVKCLYVYNKVRRRRDGRGIYIYIEREIMMVDGGHGPRARERVLSSPSPVHSHPLPPRSTSAPSRRWTPWPASPTPSPSPPPPASTWTPCWTACGARWRCAACTQSGSARARTSRTRSSCPRTGAG